MIQAFKMAMKSISGNKFRAFLTMLGIIIGVMALVILVSLVSGATGTVTDTISSLGSNLLTVTVSDDKGKPVTLGIGTWTNPKGGYFVSFESLDGCAKEIVSRCKKAGLVLTNAGATYPYGKDPHDSNIRIAPSFPSCEDLQLAMDVFTCVVKLVSVKKYLAEMDAQVQ